MVHLLIKALVSGLIVAAISEAARRHPGWGGLLASLPLTSLLAMLWLYHDRGSSEQLAAFSISTFWFVLPSLPLFPLFSSLLRSGVTFWIAFGVCIAATLGLYALFFWAAPKLGINP